MKTERYKELLTKMNTVLNGGIEYLDESVIKPGVALMNDYTATVKKEKEASDETVSVLVNGLAEIVVNARKTMEEKNPFKEAYDITMKIIEECSESDDADTVYDFKITLSKNVYPNLRMISDSIKTAEKTCLDSDVFDGEAKKSVEEYIGIMTGWRKDAEKYEELTREVFGSSGETEQIVVRVKDGILLFGHTLEAKVNSTIEKYGRQGWTAVSVNELEGEDTLFTTICNFYKSILNLGKDKHNRMAEIVFEREV